MAFQAPPTSDCGSDASSTRSNLPSLAEMIEKLGIGPTQLRFIFTGGGVWFADGSELLLISAVTSSVAAEWNLDPLQRGSMVTIVYLGVMVGNIISGPISDKHGRRQLILASYIGIFVFSMISSFMMSFWSLCLWRFLVGFSFGIGQPPWNVLAAEVTPAKWRLAVNGISQGLFAIGEVYSSILIMMEDPDMKNLNWRKLLQLGAIPSLLFWVAASFFLHQSPFFLAQSGQHSEAREVLTVMQRDNCLPTFSVNFARHASADTSEESSTAETYASAWRQIGTGSLQLTTAITCYTCFTCNLVYYGCLYAFPNLLPTLNAKDVPGSSAALQLLIGALWEIPGIFLACALGMFVARKPVLKLYCTMLVIALLVFVNGARGGQGTFPTLAWHVGYYLIKCFVVLGFTTVYIYVAEVYPTNVRTTGVSINIAFGRLGSTISPLVYEKLFADTGTFVAFFYMLAGLVFINLLMIDFLPIETHNADLKDTVEEEFKSEYGATGLSDQPRIA